ncbi:hypothetical protein B566_EDAN016130 [Ephemera danica]|nr:hypothetical protein B566_EDAN016130 [Ephemera danica]
MRSVRVALVLALCALMAPRYAHAWGGLFNRFSPEMLSNLGYGGRAGPYRSQPFLQSPVEVLEELREDDDEPCYGKKCTANEHCCPGSVCVYVDGIVGSCLFAYGLQQGELCRRDNDCETGLLCADAGGEPRTCQPPSRTNKQYSMFVLQRSTDLHWTSGGGSSEDSRATYSGREAHYSYATNRRNAEIPLTCQN